MRRHKFGWAVAILAAVVIAGVAGPANADIVFTESFESPDVTGTGNATDPTGWATNNHPSYVTLYDVDSGLFTTPYGTQAVSVYNSTTYCKTTSSILSDVLAEYTTYTLTFNVAKNDTKPQGNYKGDLLAVDGGGVETMLGRVTGSATTSDMSESYSLAFALDSSNSDLAGQRIVISLGHYFEASDWSHTPLYDNVQLDATAATVLYSNGSAAWGVASTWLPPQIPTADNACVVNSGHQVNVAGATDEAKWLKVEAASSKVTVDSGAALTAFDVVATSDGALDVAGTLDTGALAVDSGSMNVTGTLIASVLNSSGTVTIGPAANIAGVGLINLNGGSITGTGALTLKEVNLNSGTLAAGGLLTVDTLNMAGGAVDLGAAPNNLKINDELFVTSGSLDMTAANMGSLDVSTATVVVQGGTLKVDEAVTAPALVYDSGALNLGGSDLTVDELEVNANLDLSTSQVAASASVYVANATLTVGNDIATETLTLDGGAIVGGAATASTKYSFRNVADYSADITGASAELIIGEERILGDHKVKLSGTGNTYGGNTTINRGTLEVAPDAANIGTGALVFNATNVGGEADYRKLPTSILQTSGTFARNIGTGPGEVKWTGAGGFAATDQPLRVELNGGGGQVSLNDIGGGDGQQIGSFTSTAPVTLANGINNTWNLYFNTWDNPDTNDDLMIIEGDIALNNGNFAKNGAGTMWLKGTTTTSGGAIKTFTLGEGQSGTAPIIDGPVNVLRVEQGVGLPNNASIYFRSGVIETSGTFDRQCRVAGGVDWHNVYSGGGFSAYGGPLEVKLIPAAGGSAGDPLEVGPDIRGKDRNSHSGLFLGSATADNVVTWVNDISRTDLWTITVGGNPDVETDWAEITGDLSFTKDLYIYGMPTSPGELKLRGTTTATTVFARTGVVLGGDGTINGKLTIEGGSSVAPGASVGTLTVTGNTQLQNDSIYEWEVGQTSQPVLPGETDVLNITGGNLNLDNFVLKILDADGYVANDTVQLPVFTYSGATVDMGGFPNTAANFDTSALGGTWTVGALSLTDDMAGTIYLTGLSGGLPPFIVWDGGDGNWNVDADWEPDGPTTASSNCRVENADDHLHVTDAQLAGSLAITAGMVDVESLDGDLAVTNDVNVGENGTLNVNGNLSAAEVICEGTLSGDGGTIEADFIEIVGDVSPGNSVGTLTVDGELELIAGKYLCEIDSTGADLIHNANEDEGILLSYEGAGGTLVLEPLEALGDPGCYTDTILSTSGAGEIEGDFLDGQKPAEGDYLEYGVFLDGYETVNTGAGVNYNLNLFQAGEGDTDGDGDVDLDDLSRLDDGWDPTAEDKIWTDGDVDGDGDVDLDDLSLLDDNWAPAGYPLVNCPFGGGGLGATAVPEPGTLALLAIGLLGLALWRRWRRGGLG